MLLWRRRLLLLLLLLLLLRLLLLPLLQGRLRGSANRQQRLCRRWRRRSGGRPFHRGS
jgi:hypothetical protein